VTALRTSQLYETSVIGLFKAGGGVPSKGAGSCQHFVAFHPKVPEDDEIIPGSTVLDPGLIETPDIGNEETGTGCSRLRM
jgi:hypothetical protein